MAVVGATCLKLALLVCAYGIGASLYGATTGRREWVRSGRRAMFSVAGLTLVAFAILEAAFLRSDFGFDVVASHSSTTTPAFYRAAAVWSSQEGSLLLWLLLLSLWSSLALVLTRRRLRDVVPYAQAVLLGFGAFFCGLLVFAASPFDTTSPAPVEGIGLTPLLRHPSMMIHPPMLYSGYTLFAIPFAFAIGALVVRRVDAEWITSTRRFALAAWFFLGIGIILGARWSYAELGWGGYWAWDPVENASLLPWLTGTAFIHSLMIQEKRGMLKVWNASLVLATGTLCILGTFLVRSGVLDSIHAFGASTLGVPFVTLIGIMVVGSVWLVTSRRATLRTEHRIDSLLSREAAFLGNNVVLVGMAFVVFWGTFFPLISEAVTGQKAAVGPPWFDRYTVPLALVLVLLTGVGPVIAWRRATWANARRAFALPVAAGVVTLVVLAAAGVRSSATALAMFAVAAFAVSVAAQELWRGTQARRAMSGEAAPRAVVSLVRRNRRRYGGYLVHVGMAVLLVGVAASSAFQHAHDSRLQVGQSTKVGDYTVRYVRATSGIDVRAGDVERLNFGAVLDVSKGGRHVATLRPQRGYYPSRAIVAFGPVGRFFEGESVSEVGMRAGPLRDVWTAVQPDISTLRPTIAQGDKVLTGATAAKLTPREGSIALAEILGALVRRYADTPPPAQFRVISSPLVTWVWLGGILVFVGGLIAIWPAPDAAHRRARAGYAARVARELGRA